MRMEREVYLGLQSLLLPVSVFTKRLVEVFRYLSSTNTTSRDVLHHPMPCRYSKQPKVQIQSKCLLEHSHSLDILITEGPIYHAQADPPLFPMQCLSLWL